MIASLVRILSIILVSALVVAPSNAARGDKTDAGANHTMCSAYSAVLAQQLYWAKDIPGSIKMGKWAEEHAERAIAHDERKGLMAWATRDIISQLTIKMKKSAQDPNKMLEFGRKLGGTCAALAKQMLKR